MTNNYRYKAFISYRHVARDRKWARWLASRLEAYRTPRGLVRQGVVARMGRLFLDDDEVPSSYDLSHQVENALRDSEYLIVVCSPDAALSEWIRREIEFFRAIGRGDKILVLLVAGEPKQAFPPALLRSPEDRIVLDDGRAANIVYTGPIAADVRQRTDEKLGRTKRRALLRIAAGLLGVGFDDIVQREQQRRVRRRIVWSTVFATVLVVAFFGFLTVKMAAGERTEEGWVVHTYQTMEALDTIYSSMNDAAASVRGYNITRRASYLQSYRHTSLNIAKYLDRFELLTSDNAQEQSRARALAKLTNDQLANLREELASSLGDIGQRAKLQDVMVQGEAMRNAQGAAIALALSEERRLLAIRIEARRELEKSEIISAFVTALTGLLVLSGTVLASALRSDWI